MASSSGACHCPSNQRPALLSQATEHNKVKRCEKIGLGFRTDVLTHGQLCVALNRAQNKQSVQPLVNPNRIFTDTPTPRALSTSSLYAMPRIPIPPLLPRKHYKAFTITLPPSATRPPPRLPQLPPPPSPSWLWHVQSDIGDGTRSL